MYFWNISALAADLKENRLSQKEIFKYFFLYIFLSAVLMEAAVFLTPNAYQIFEAISAVLVITIGTYLCYSINSKNDNQDFIERYVCLGLPVGVRLIAIGLPAYLIIFFILETAGYSIENTIFDVFLMAIMEALYFLWLIKYIKIVSKKDIH